MNKIIVAGFWFFSLVASFYAGMRIGIVEYFRADSQYHASIVAGQLRLIDAKRIDDLRGLLNIELDGQLAQYGDYLDSRLKWIWPELRAETPRAIQSAVGYRVNHPYKWPSLDLEGADESFVRDQAEGAKHLEQQRDRVIKQYAK